MIPEEKVKSEISSLLQELHNKTLSQLEDKPIELAFHARTTLELPPIIFKQDALYEIQNLGGIKILEDRNTHDIHGEHFFYTLKVLQPKFDEIYEQRQNIVGLKGQEIIWQRNRNNLETETPQQSQRPYCFPENGIGYIKFGEYGERIKIGKLENQPFKLLQCLIEPFGRAKSVETVFEAIRESIKNKSKRGTYTDTLDRSKKVKLIQYVIKELQKGNKLKGRLKFKWDAMQTKIWLEYVG